MKLVADRKSLQAALAITAPLAASNRIHAVLQNVLLTADCHRCILHATDYDVVAQVEFTGTLSDSGGSVLAPAALLRSMISSLDDDEVLLETEKNTLHVRGSRTKHRVPTVDHNDFPALPVAKWAVDASLPMAELSAAIKAMSRQVDDESSRYQIGCIAFDFGPDGLHLCATDGRTAGTYKTSAGPTEATLSLLGPKAANLIASIKADGNAVVRSGENWMQVEFPGGLIMARLTEGRFPRWREMFPAELNRDCKAEIVPGVLTACIRRSCIATPDVEHGPEALMRIADGDLRFTCQVGGTESESFVPCQHQGETKALLNWQYLLDAAAGFALFGDEPISVSCDGKGREGLLLSRDGLRYVIMPKHRE